jgi:hypothetical protein
MFGALAFGLLGVSNCAATCIGTGRGTASHSSLHFQPGQIRLLPAGFFKDDDWDHHDDAIVGFWRQELVSKGTEGVPDGTVLENGLSQAHSDHTEILNSSRPPISGNFCLGVWEKVGERTYNVNHFLLAWDSTGTTFIGPTELREEVTVDPDGDHYSGTFTLENYSEDSTRKLTLILPIVNGVTSGTRIKVDTSTESIF